MMRVLPKDFWTLRKLTDAMCFLFQLLTAPAVRPPTM
jgi:hypothetical protein